MHRVTHDTNPTRVEFQGISRQILLRFRITVTRGEFDANRPPHMMGRED